MADAALVRRLLVEALGSALLLATVVGSGIMADRLSAGNTGVALLANALATGAMLFVLITAFGPVSGAHFNPVVSGLAALRGDMSWRDAGSFIGVQLIGALCGVLLANAMFDLPVLQIAAKTRASPGQWLSEAVATFGLLITIHGTLASKPPAVPQAVALYIVAAYWFTASTSFANPAVTVARMFSDTFAGINPSSVPMFIIAQLIGAGVAAWAIRRIWP